MRTKTTFLASDKFPTRAVISHAGMPPSRVTAGVKVAVFSLIPFCVVRLAHYVVKGAVFRSPSLLLSEGSSPSPHTSFTVTLFLPILAYSISQIGKDLLD